MIHVMRLLQRAMPAVTLCALMVVAFSSQAQVSAFEDPNSSASGSTVAGGQEFAPAKPEVEGGDIAQGQTNQVIVMMRNNSGTPLSVKKIDLVPSSNVSATVVANQCDKEPVKPGIECPITVSVKAESSGKYRVGILVNHTGRSQVSNIAITGNVGAGASAGAGGMPLNEIEAYPNKVEFGTVKGRAPLVRSINLRNGSSKEIRVENIELAASPLTGFSVSAPNCKILQASQSCIATVTWAPIVEGKVEGVLVLRHNGPSGSLQIPLTGEYTLTKTEKAERFPTAVPGQGLIVADRDTVEFGTDIDGAASITVTLVNTGDKEVKMSQVRLAGSDNGLSLSGDDCVSGKVLKPNQGCALTVNWLPRRKGPVIDDIQVIHDGARGVLVLPVRGSAKETVSTNMPVFSSSSLPKLDVENLDEKLVQGGDAASSRKPGSRSSNSMVLGGDPSSLNGYRVTSLSATRAVITGSSGRIVVDDGVPELIAGSHWVPRVSNEGVELVGASDSVFLFFDRSLGAISVAADKGGLSSSSGAAPAAPQPSPTSGSGGQ